MRDLELQHDDEEELRGWTADQLAAVEESEQPCWLCGRKQEHAGIEPDASWDWSHYEPASPPGERHGPLCPRCAEEDA